VSNNFGRLCFIFYYVCLKVNRGIKSNHRIQRGVKNSVSFFDVQRFFYCTQESSIVPRVFIKNSRIMQTCATEIIIPLEKNPSPPRQIRQIEIEIQMNATCMRNENSGTHTSEKWHSSIRICICICMWRWICILLAVWLIMRPPFLSVSSTKPSVYEFAFIIVPACVYTSISQAQPIWDLCHSTQDEISPTIDPVDPLQNLHAGVEGDNNRGSGEKREFREIGPQR